MNDPYDRVREALRPYIDAVEVAWNHPSYTNEPYTSTQSTRRIVTKAVGDQPTRLPKTQRLVRGAEGVEVVKEEVPPPRNPKPTVGSALSRASAKWRHYPPLSEGEEKVIQAVKDAESQVVEALASIPSLLERTHDFSGFKNYDIETIRGQIAAEATEEDPNDSAPLRRQFSLGWPLTRYLVEGLEERGLDPNDPASFDDWKPVIEHAIARFRELETRETWTYEVVALLNAPPIDHDGQLHLVATTVDGQPVTVTIEAATDELLNDLDYRNYNFTGVGAGLATAPINAALRYRITVPVEAPMSEYVQVLSSAVDLFTRIVDVLRLVRTDDLGIIGVESLSIEREAPTIRYHYDVGHNPTYASVVPRRSYFFLQDAAPLSDEHLATLRETLPAYLDGSHGVQGLDVAMRRYRDSRERYRPGDPEQLLDLTIALEALLLTGGERSELTYRLGIRAARLLGTSADSRRGIFDVLRDLYAVRSKLAHGSTLDNMKPAEAQKVQTALDLAPAVLRLTILRFLRGEGPSGLKDKKLTEWWRSVELGDGTDSAKTTADD